MNEQQTRIVEVDDVEVEHIAHKSGCAIHHHTVGVTCDCGATSWFEIMPRKEYEAMLPMCNTEEIIYPSAEMLE